MVEKGGENTGYEAAVGIEQVQRGRVIHGVAAARQRIAHRDGVEAAQQRRQSRAVTAQADELAAEGAEIGLECGGGVALRIDTDEDHLRTCQRRLALHLRQYGERGRTDVGTIGEAEEQQGRMAAQVIRSKIAAGQVLQMKFCQRARARQPGTALQRDTGSEQVRQQCPGCQREHAQRQQQQDGAAIHAAIIS